MTPIAVEEIREARERIVGNLTDLRQIAKGIGDDFLAYLLGSALREARTSLVRGRDPDGAYSGSGASVIPFKPPPKRTSAEMTGTRAEAGVIWHRLLAKSDDASTDRHAPNMDPGSSKSDVDKSSWRSVGAPATVRNVVVDRRRWTVARPSPASVDGIPSPAQRFRRRHFAGPVDSGDCFLAGDRSCSRDARADYRESDCDESRQDADLRRMNSTRNDHVRFSCRGGRLQFEPERRDETAA